MQKLQNFEQQINELFKGKKYQEIYELCIAELKKFPENIKGLSREEYEYIAKVYSVLAEIFKTQDPQEALKCMDCAINFVGNSASYYIQRGRIKETLSDLQGAFEDYSIVINNDPCFEAYGFRGSVRLKTADYEEALADLTKALELNPEYSGGYIQRGRAKEELGKLQEAIKDYNKAIELCPDYPYTYGCRGNAKIKLNDLEGALDDFRKCMELNPNDIMAKKAFVDIKTALAGEAGIATMTCTKKDGTIVCQYMTDEGIIEIPVTK